ncbi:low temperature requirement protein A [Ktedonosporobacter rubrisoli]|nr:low temperature requirement protein A [Ktedonosporobacter rubrisoli]
MMRDTGRIRVLRERSEDEARVTSAELFFDLVYVFAVTQLTRYLLAHLSLRGAGETLLLLLAVWLAWNSTGWTTNYFDPDTLPVRLMLMGVMLVSLIMSVSLPEAFGDRGPGFAWAFVVIQIGRTLFALAALGRRNVLRLIYLRVLVWWSISGLLWLAGALMHEDIRIIIWAAAVTMDYVIEWCGFPVPGLGRSRTADYTIVGGHLAERCEQFVIIALGESIVDIGISFAEQPSAAATVAGFAVAFITSVALWWIYFDREAQAGRQVISATADPGRLGVSAYTYFHIPMVAGIIAVAGAFELTITHPTEQASAALTILILGGLALYLFGNALFRRALWNYMPWSRLVAIVVLVALVPLTIILSALLLLTLATLILVALGLWDVSAAHMKLRAP